MHTCVSCFSCEKMQRSEKVATDAVCPTQQQDVVPRTPKRKRKRSYSCTLDSTNFYVSGGFDNLRALLTGKLSLNVGFRRAKSSAEFSEVFEDETPATIEPPPENVTTVTAIEAV